MCLHRIKIWINKLTSEDSVNDPKKNNEEKSQGVEWLIYLAIFLSLIFGVLLDNKPWLITATAILIPVLFGWLIYVYTKKDAESVKLSLIWGVLGLSMLLFGVYADPLVINSHIVSVVINLASTLLSLAAIGVILQLKDTKEYFASALSDLIMKESYVEKLNTSQLEKLQKTILERYFENSNDFNRENSFYKFFSKNLQRYIGSPYRENYSNTISINSIEGIGPLRKESKACRVTDDLTYKIRSMGTDLQKEIIWRTAKDEIKELEKFTVCIGSVELFSWPSSLEQDSASELINHNFSSNPENGVEIRIQLEKLSQTNPMIKDYYVDGAVVKIAAKYVATNYKSITTKLLFPTKGFSLSVFHESNFRCKVEPYGLDEDVNPCDHNETPQGFTFGYSDWILPNSGVYIAIEEINLVGEKYHDEKVGGKRSEELSTDSDSSDGL